MFIKDWFSIKDDEYKKKVCNAMEEILEVVVLKVNTETEAFQLFDSQNTRGKALYPHDLLKAYHLRAMQGNPHEMRHAVQKWEAVDAKKISELFEWYLFPITNWAKQLNTKTFTAKEIDIYKGIAESTNYTYAKRAKKAIPYFQITEPFVEGEDYFDMVEYYLKMLDDIKLEISTNPKFIKLNEILKVKKGMGYNYTKNLFWCALMFYYDRFHNFEEKAVKKLFLWAFMLRVDMERLGYDSINKYAIENGDTKQYSNSIPMFFRIAQSRLHTEIENIQINTYVEQQKLEKNASWKNLYDDLLELKGDNKSEQ